MKIAVIGAAGTVGSRLTDELLRRGHQVTGVSRQPDPEEQHRVPALVAGDVQDPAGLAKLISGHDAVVHSVRFVNSDPAKVISAVKKGGVGRLLVVGGAGSLEVAPGVELIDTPGFPVEYKAEAGAGREFLNVLRQENELNWTYLSPSAMFAPGERTGKFRLGRDQLLVGPDRQSRISIEDFAIALTDEIEQPRHVRQRFTVGY
jgi:putative NADH-flavin reductase